MMGRYDVLFDMLDEFKLFAHEVDHDQRALEEMEREVERAQTALRELGE